MDPALRELLTRVFLPNLADAVKRLDQGVRLAHYTGFETAVKILDGRAVWMRDARLMNDIGEIRHGIDALAAFLSSPTNLGRLRNALLPFVPEAALNELASYAERMRALVAQGQVFITCVSEHRPAEDGFGRLSMWRAYCAAPDGVAIVMKPAPFRLPNNALNATPAPYCTETPGHLRP